MSDVAFQDCETLGLNPRAPIWEYAGIRRYGDGTQREFQCLIEHDPGEWLRDFPEYFRDDYRQRYDEAAAIPAPRAAQLIADFTRGAHVVGACPSFDTERLNTLFERHGIEREPWHYHLCDVENVVVGYLAAKGRLMLPPWDSEVLSRAVGVEPEQFKRHSAMGDVLWVQAQWDAVMM